MFLCKGWTNSGIQHQIFAGFSASMAGFSYTLMIAWVSPILPYLQSRDSEIPMTSDETSWILSIPLVTSFISSVPAAMLTNVIGRKPVILVIGPVFASGWIIIAYFKTYEALLVARFIQGVGAGIVFSTVPVYLAEIASTEFRGAITSLFFILQFAGYLFIYSTGNFMTFSNYLTCTIIASLAFFPMFCFQPETPYFYLMINNVTAAKKSLKYFRSLPETSFDQELEAMMRNVEEDKLKKPTWGEVIVNKADRRALLLIIFVNTIRVLCGVSQMLSYAADILSITLKLAVPAQFVAISLATVLLLASSCSFFILDVFGRRPVFIACCLIASVCLLITSCFFYLLLETSVDVSFYSFLPAIMIVLACGASVAGICPLSSAFAELFTSNTRSKCCGISTTFVTFILFASTKLYQDFVNVFGVYFNFLVFGIVCFIGSVVSYFYMPETKNKSFEEIRNELMIS